MEDVKLVAIAFLDIKKHPATSPVDLILSLEFKIFHIDSSLEFDQFPWRGGGVYKYLFYL